MITYQTEDIEMPAIKKRETTEWIKAVAATYGKKIGEIAYIFCSDEKILEVNRQYLGHDYYTDIITFGGQPPERRPLHQPGHRAHQCRPILRRRLRPGTAPGHHPRHPAPVRHQRQRIRRTGNYGGSGEQGVGAIGKHRIVKKKHK